MPKLYLPKKKQQATEPGSSVSSHSTEFHPPSACPHFPKSPDKRESSPIRHTGSVASSRLSSPVPMVLPWEEPVSMEPIQVHIPFSVTDLQNVVRTETSLKTHPDLPVTYRP